MRNILIVDDAVFMRQTIINALKGIDNVQFHEASDGERAVELFKQISPDVVILDITMPLKDGLTCLKEMKEIKADCKVIMCSAVGQQAKIAQAIELGAADFVVKPFDDSKFKNKINKLLCQGTKDEVIKKTLIVVDMQKDFVDGALGTSEAVAIVDNVKKKIAQYKNEGGEIIFTRDTHRSNYMETNEGRNLPVVHCVENTPGWQIYDGIDTEGAVIVNKPSFGYMNWKDYDLECVELVGLCTDICVVSNALIIKATYPEIDVTVDASCCAGVSPATHKAALETMKCCQVKVIGE